MSQPPETNGEHRSGEDRRRRPTPALSRYMFVGRRRGGRRAGERSDIYVDRYSGLEWSLVIGVIALCLADLLLTLDILERGGSEWNPFMRLALEGGTWTFVWVKMGLTVLGMGVLLVRIRFRNMRKTVTAILVLYTLLIGYHFGLRAAWGKTPPVGRAATLAPIAGPPSVGSEQADP